MSTKKSYSNELKLKVVLESFQRDTTIEKVKRAFNVSHSVVHRWRKIFKEYGAMIFDQPAKKKEKSAKYFGQTKDELVKIIGDLTVENQVLKKTLVSLG